MNLKNVAIILASLVLVLALRQDLASDEVLSVSMVGLIAAPERYNNKMVSTIGYVVLEFEDDGLYLSESDAKNGIRLNSLYLALSEEELKKYLSLSKSYVLVQGMFDATNRGHGSLKSGSITNIQRLEKW